VMARSLGKMAVERRTCGMRASRCEALELFATLATLTRQADSASLLTPASARALGDAVDDLARMLRQ
jgi:hypothetical protein